MEIELLLTADPKVERLRFGGIIYRRYPKAKRPSDRNYYRCGIADRARGFSFLHRDVWISRNGPIPEGWHVHHKDENPLNNDPTNLEALPPLAHKAKHVPSAQQRSAIAYKKTALYKRERMAEKARSWHGSAEGRQWHSEHARASALARKLRELACDQCGVLFKGLGTAGRRSFCSNACKSKWRRDHRTDDVEMQCRACGLRFFRNKYAKSKGYCGRLCARRARHWRGVQSEG